MSYRVMLMSSATAGLNSNVVVETKEELARVIAENLKAIEELRPIARQFVPYSMTVQIECTPERSRG